MGNQSDSSQSQAASCAADAIILAAGKGTRMGADMPKVMFQVAGKPMLWWVIQACKQAGIQRIILVVGHGSEQVKAAFADDKQCFFVEQTQLLGTGHAAQMAEPLFDPNDRRDVIILGGDGPLIGKGTLEQLLQTHQREKAAATLATAVIDDPTGYGRVLRDSAGQFEAIVEQKDATDEQLAVKEINPSYYCFASDKLFASLKQVQNDNQQGEYYLTDVPGLLKASGECVAVVDAVRASEVYSINTPAQLEHVAGILRDRLAMQPADKDK